MPRPGQQRSGLLEILGGIAVRGGASHLLIAARAGEAARRVTVEEGVADGDVDGVGGGVGEVRIAAGAHGSDEQPESGDGHGEGVEVDASDGVERSSGQLPRVRAGFLVPPTLEQPGEGTKEEVARPTRWVYQGRLPQPERRKRRF